MKKVLIIQQDEAYFLFETFQLLERQWNSLKEVELHLLVDSKAYQEISSSSSPLFKNVHFHFESIKELSFDQSFNLSMNEESWTTHDQVNSFIKAGPYFNDGTLFVKDLWSIHLLTLKAKAPFLTIHLQDIYRKVLGLGPSATTTINNSPIDRIVYVPFSTLYFTAEEQEKFLLEISRAFPSIPIVDLGEVDHIEDLSGTLYIGPLSLDACKLASNGTRGVFLQSHFQGFNLFPYGKGNILISSQGKKFDSKSLSGILEGAFKGRYKADIPYAVYTSEHEISSSLFLKSQGKIDNAYPIYKSHFILWNFILSLEDVDLSLDLLSIEQQQLLNENLNILKKLSALQEFALVATNSILKQAKAKLVDTQKLEENMEKVREYDQTSFHIAEAHPYLRPFLDFYRIRKGQTSAFTLQEQAEESFIIYSEEQQVLSALSELFSVTLNKNEVKI